MGCHGAVIGGENQALRRAISHSMAVSSSVPVAVKIEGSLVPCATTVWDSINRGMPWAKPGSLTPDEVYAVTAHVLFLNQIVGH